VRIRAQDLSGRSFELDLEGLPARIVQHEGDHLDGILFFTRLSETEKLLARKVLKRLEKEYRRREKASKASVPR
jgi:peptide deformylase